MPRRNIHLIVGLTVVCLVCAVKVSREGRILVYAMDQVRLRYVKDVPRRELFEGAMQGMMRRLDDYSEYIGPVESPKFQETLDKQFGGIGIEIVLDPQTKQLTVASPLVGTPAYEAGILAGDQILRIEGQSTRGLSLEDAQAWVRGRPGEPVTLTVLHEGQDQPIDMEIVRAVIQVDTVLGDTRNPDGSWNYFLTGREGIAYLRINSFGDRTDQELARAVNRLVKPGKQLANDGQVELQVKPGLRGLILDLRNNPGGMLGAAIRVCDLFVDSGVIVTTRRREGSIQHTATKDGTYSGFPVAVLVNGLSASASEIVAACLQDHRRAVIVGQRTFGKGTVQEIIPLEPRRGMLKLTTAGYWRPSGKNIDRQNGKQEGQWGVSPDPDYEVELDAEQRASLFLARLRRDISKSANGEDASVAPEPFDPRVDPQLAKAVEYIENTSDRPQ